MHAPTPLNTVTLTSQRIDRYGNASVKNQVIGTLAAKGTGGYRDPDDQILIPLSTARGRLFGTSALRTINVQIVSEEAMDRAQGEIEELLRSRHRIQPGAPSDFSIGSQKDLLDTATQVSDTFTALLAAVAAVSLLVGGIGIMNIMLVSVTERTREIGVRKALGATRRNILVQFVVEAVVLCLVGGAMGILLGSLGAVLLSRLAHWNTLVSPGAILMAFCFSVAVGLFFGIWPARRAATLDPIEALRYE